MLCKIELDAQYIDLPTIVGQAWKPIISMGL
jgi:hypothetical protein